jgi:hypothetical protein
LRDSVTSAFDRISARLRIVIFSSKAAPNGLLTFVVSLPHFINQTLFDGENLLNATNQVNGQTTAIPRVVQLPGLHAKTLYQCALSRIDTS